MWFAPATAELSNSAWPLVQRDMDALDESQESQPPKSSYDAWGRFSRLFTAFLELGSAS